MAAVLLAPPFLWAAEPGERAPSPGAAQIQTEATTAPASKAALSASPASAPTRSADTGSVTWSMTPAAKASAAARRAAPAPAIGAASLVVVKFMDADVDAVARAVAAILGRPILVDPRVKGKMTLVSDEGLTRPQVYQYFASTLRGLGYAVVESAGLLKVVPEGDAKVQSGTVVAGTEPRGQDQIVTRIFQLQYENASNLVAVLRPLITANNTINVNAGNNSLVITDYADNQTRLAAIIAALDTPSATDVEVIPLKHMQAATVAQIVSKMVDGVQRAQGGSSGTVGGTAGSASAGGAGTAGGGSAQVYADVTSNALLVRAPSQARLQAIRALVSRLDKPGNNGIAGSSIHVIYLKHAEATRLASVLRAAFSAQDTNNGLNASDSGSTASSAGRSSSSTTAFSSMAGSSSGSTSGSGSGSSSTSSTQATAPVSATAEPSTGGFIQADPATNALIVTASEPDSANSRRWWTCWIPTGPRSMWSR